MQLNSEQSRAVVLGLTSEVKKHTDSFSPNKSVNKIKGRTHRRWFLMAQKSKELQRELAPRNQSAYFSVHLYIRLQMPPNAPR